MKLILDVFSDLGIKEYLLTQNGIDDVKIFTKEDSVSEFDITYNDKITPTIILKHIELYENKKTSILLGFNKATNKRIKKLKYTIDDMCCECCYKDFVTQLFKNENIQSVVSNFDFHKPACNIEFLIEYNEDYEEKELINYIKEAANN